MGAILIATLVVGIVGLVIGVALVFAGKKFYVEVDERETQVRECLPGNNCGACGYPGCDGVAAAIVAGEILAISNKQIEENLKWIKYKNADL